MDADGDGTWLTIQQAVDAASEGDVITVCPGVYDSVVIDTVGVTLRGYGADSTCIVGTTAAALTIVGVDVDVSGFTVSVEGTSPAAIDARSSSGRIHDLRVTGVRSDQIEYAAVARDSAFDFENVASLPTMASTPCTSSRCSRMPPMATFG